MRSDNRHDSNHPRLARGTEGRRAWPDLASSTGHLCRPPRPVKPLSGFSETRVYLDAGASCAGARVYLGASVGMRGTAMGREASRVPPCRDGRAGHPGASTCVATDSPLRVLRPPRISRSPRLLKPLSRSSETRQRPSLRPTQPDEIAPHTAPTINPPEWTQLAMWPTQPVKPSTSQMSMNVTSCCGIR